MTDDLFNRRKRNITYKLKVQCSFDVGPSCLFHTANEPLLNSTLNTSFIKLSQDMSVTEIAFLKGFLPNQMVERINSHCFEFYTRHLKTNHKQHYYIGQLDSNMPMLYTSSDSFIDEGKYLTNNIVSELTFYIEKILSVCNAKTLKLLRDLHFSTIFPVVAFNIIDKTTDHTEANNRVIISHKDKQDIGVSILFYFGRYKEGHLVVHDDNNTLQIQTEVGDVLVFRGNDYNHYVSALSSNEDVRFSVVFYCHKFHIHRKSYLLPQKQALDKFKEEHPNYCPTKKKRKP